MFACWAILIAPDFLATYWVQKTIFDIEWLVKNTLRRVLPIFPTDTLQAFDFGEMASHIDHAVLMNDSQKVDMYLNQM